MAEIKDFIAAASAQLHEPEDQTRQATGALLATLQSRVEPSDFKELLAALPGAQDLVAAPAAGPAPAPRPGLMGAALGSMAAKVSGPAGAPGLIGMIQKTGFAPGKVAGLVKKFVEFAKGSAGDGLVKKLFAQLPELATLAA